jgi:hypothetical protein
MSNRTMRPVDGAPRDPCEAGNGGALLAGNTGDDRAREIETRPTTSSRRLYMSRHISAAGTARTTSPLWRALLVAWLGSASDVTLFDDRTSRGE